jgi:Fe2+ or Zn2+ uptake regulation protein
VRSPDDLTAAFRERGLKVTPQRRAVFRALHDDHTHPSAEVVYARVAAEVPGISLRTVYQTLNDLADMGEILHLELGTGAARFDANVEEPHHHLVCEGCGMVRDLSGGADAAADGDLAETYRAALPEGFRITSAEVVLRGRCAACAAVAERGAT